MGMQKVIICKQTRNLAGTHHLTSADSEHGHHHPCHTRFDSASGRLVYSSSCQESRQLPTTSPGLRVPAWAATESRGKAGAQSNGEGERDGASPCARRLAPRLLRRRRRRGAGDWEDPRYAASPLLTSSSSASLWSDQWIMRCLRPSGVMIWGICPCSSPRPRFCWPEWIWCWGLGKTSERVVGEIDQVFTARDASTLPLLIHERTSNSALPFRHSVKRSVRTMNYFIMERNKIQILRSNLPLLFFNAIWNGSWSYLLYAPKWQTWLSYEFKNEFAPTTFALNG